MIEVCKHCGRERPDYIHDPTCPKSTERTKFVYCDWVNAEPSARGKPASMTWIIVSQLMTNRERGRRVLGLMVALDTLLVTAVETTKPRKAIRDSPAATTAHVFNEHGHKVLGTFASLPLAMIAAETFADAWAAGEAKIAECECEDME